MSDSIFGDLKASLEEAVAIENGQLEAGNAIGYSLDTVKSWESKSRNPTGPTAKRLIAISKRPEIYQDLRNY